MGDTGECWISLFRFGKWEPYRNLSGSLLDPHCGDIMSGTGI